MFNKIKSTIDVEEGVLACGVSDGRANDGSRLPNYPANESISHWIIIDGYYWETTTETPTKLSYVDPAKSDAISWSGAITAYGDTTIENIYKFTSSRGIIY